MVGLETNIGNLKLETPLIAVSGIYGVDYELLTPSFPDIGAVVTKSVTLLPRKGNPEPRIIETRAGALNSIGLQNPGVDVFIASEIPKLRTIEVPVIASVAGSSIHEYVECVKRLSNIDQIDGIELNVSCPNAEMIGMEFGSDPVILEELVSKVRKVIHEKTLIVKLSPNVTDIATMAQAAVNGGTSAISLINTLHGMAIDIITQKPRLGNRVGGLSGIGIHPVAVYMIRQCYISCCHRYGIPIIGIGGIANDRNAHEDALEFILAGATCVGIGTAIFRDDGIPIFKAITRGMTKYLKEKHLKLIQTLIGKAAPEQLFSFKEIGEYLNIPKATARTLGEQQLLPGCSNAGRWETTTNEIDNWYITINGQRWADLVSNGQVDPISIEVNVGIDIQPGKLTRVLSRWASQEVIDIEAMETHKDGMIVASIKLTQLLKTNKDLMKTVAASKDSQGGIGQIAQSVRQSLTVAFQSHLALANQQVIVSLSPNGILIMRTEDPLALLPQRDREIIKYKLLSYANQLANELKAELSIINS